MFTCHNPKVHYHAIASDTPAYTEVIHARLIFRSARPSGYNFTTVKAQTSGSGMAILTDLKKYRKYGVVIQAFNEKGPGPMSSEIVAQTLEDGAFFKKPLVFNLLSNNFTICLYSKYLLCKKIDSKCIFVIVIKFLGFCCSMYCLFYVVLCIVCV